MSREKKTVLTVEYSSPQEKKYSLKQKLVAAVANGDEMVAQELRMLLKIEPTENLPGSATKSGH